MNLRRISEGKFKQGLLNGFGKIIDNKGNCYAGFWKANQIQKSIAGRKLERHISGPYGKW